MIKVHKIQRNIEIQCDDIAMISEVHDIFRYCPALMESTQPNVLVLH